jgi:hypothetical protein
LNDRALHLIFGVTDLYEDEHLTLFTTQTSDSDSIIVKHEKNQNTVDVFITLSSLKCRRLDQKLKNEVSNERLNTKNICLGITPKKNYQIQPDV